MTEEQAEALSESADMLGNLAAMLRDIAKIELSMARTKKETYGSNNGKKARTGAKQNFSDYFRSLDLVSIRRFYELARLIQESNQASELNRKFADGIIRDLNVGRFNEKQEKNLFRTAARLGFVQLDESSTVRNYKPVKR